MKARREAYNFLMPQYLGLSRRIPAGGDPRDRTTEGVPSGLCADRCVVSRTLRFRCIAEARRPLSQFGGAATIPATEIRAPRFSLSAMPRHATNDPKRSWRFLATRCGRG